MGWLWANVGSSGRDIWRRGRGTAGHTWATPMPRPSRGFPTWGAEIWVQIWGILGIAAQILTSHLPGTTLSPPESHRRSPRVNLSGTGGGRRCPGAQPLLGPGAPRPPRSPQPPPGANRPPRPPLASRCRAPPGSPQPGPGPTGRDRGGGNGDPPGPGRAAPLSPAPSPWSPAAASSRGTGCGGAGAAPPPPHTPPSFPGHFLGNARTRPTPPLPQRHRAR